MGFKNQCQELYDHYVACYRAGDAAGCAGIFAPDATIYSPFGPPAAGRLAIEATHREWVAEGAANKRIEVTSAGRSGDLGWCVADYDEGTTGGVALAVLRRRPEGNWQITHCSLTESV